MHTVQELQEDGREAAALTAGTQVASLAEFMAKGEPLLLQQHLKTLQSPVERIAQQLHQRHHLRGDKTEVRGRKEPGQSKSERSEEESLADHWKNEKVSVISIESP